MKEFALGCLLAAAMMAVAAVVCVLATKYIL